MRHLAPHSSTGVSPAKLLFNREKRLKMPELTRCEYVDSEAQDRAAEMNGGELTMQLKGGEHRKIV